MAKILVIGNGRVARAFLEYLRREPTDPQYDVLHWHRRMDQSLHELCLKRDPIPTHIWLAVSDDSIVEFAKNHLDCLVGKTVTHFSGGKPSFEIGNGVSAGKTVKVHAAHPLTTFGDVTHANWKENFEKIPFVLEKTENSENQMELRDLLPGFRNPVFFLKPQDRVFYHALCALAGGLTVQTWETVAALFENRLDIPPAALRHFLSQIGQNLLLNLDSHRSVLTGPVARGDREMVKLHKSALEERNEALLARLYQDFETLHQRETARARAQTEERR